MAGTLRQRDVAKRDEDDLAAVDRDLALIVEREAARQDEKLIMIPSESVAPRAVREVLASVFTNIYAEGYPSLRMTSDEKAALVDVGEQLALHRRYADRRYYKGTEFADLVEALAQRRVAALFASDRVPAAGIFANVQALSGAAANNAVYEALLRPGDTMLGLALSHGGHLTHGSPHNRSGHHYHVVPYTVDLESGRLSYDEIRRLAIEHRPKLIVAGASAYPWEIDWGKLRAIVDDVPGARLMADIAHPAGLVVAGLFPNPVGYAHVSTFTTHKTLCGPRGAVILTTDEALAEKIDRAVFPGEQGGPHMNNIAAMAVALHIAATAQFRQLQRRIVANARALATTLAHLGLTLVYGGTSTHMLLVDLKGINIAAPLEGDVASRILDLGGIVCNKNAIPGDVSAARATGLRFGTVWASQRGLVESDTERLGALIHGALTSIVPFRYVGPDGDLGRGKLPYGELAHLRRGVGELLGKASQTPSTSLGSRARGLAIGGPRAKLLLQEAGTADMLDLGVGQRRRSGILNPDGTVLAEVDVVRLDDDRYGRERYALCVEEGKAPELVAWLTALSDGYVIFDPDDVAAKIEGPAVVEELSSCPRQDAGSSGATSRNLDKPYFVGQGKLLAASAGQLLSRPELHPARYDGPPRRGVLYEEHVRLNGGRGMTPFGGWVMPTWYSSIRDEHRAVRHTAALFDVTHMGVLEVRGDGAGRFLDLVTTNYVPLLAPGGSHYSFLLDPRGEVLDDCLVYCRAAERYMLVVNAANAEKVLSWLRAVSSRQCLIDLARPNVAVDAAAEIRDLRDPAIGSEGRVDLALQGPASLRILEGAIPDDNFRRQVGRLRRNEFAEGAIEDIPALVSRTGYTGEPMGFEIYVPPNDAAHLWRKLLEIGQPFGLLPAGLGARDAARTEAGYPLYGHELAGPYNVSPAGAGYGQFVKLHKPFFVGRREVVAAEQRREAELVRFGLLKQGRRVPRQGDPLVAEDGECLGHVTSCVVANGRQLGLAYVVRDRLRPGDKVGVFPLSRLPGAKHPGPELAVGEVTLVPEQAEILPRFYSSS